MKQILFALLLILVGCRKEAIHDEPKQTPPQETPKEKPATIEQVTIGTQVWMAKNLDVEKYANGDEISEIKDNIEWDTTHIGAWCWCLNGAKLGKGYGKLYNYAAMTDPRGIAPKGWHVADGNEWAQLFNYLGDNYVDQLLDTTHWTISTTATNSSGFTGLPAGYRLLIGNQAFYGLGQEAHWWTGTQYAEGVDYSWIYLIPSWPMQMGLQAPWKNINKVGLPIRCIKD